MVLRILQYTTKKNHLFASQTRKSRERGSRGCATPFVVVYYNSRVSCICTLTYTNPKKKNLLFSSQTAKDRDFFYRACATPLFAYCHGTDTRHCAAFRPHIVLFARIETPYIVDALHPCLCSVKYESRHWRRSAPTLRHGQELKLLKRFRLIKEGHLHQERGKET